MKELYENGVITDLMNAFPRLYVNGVGEAIVLPRKNIYFNLLDCTNRRDVTAKLIHFCSRLKDMSVEEKRYLLKGINKFTGRSFSLRDMYYIYRDMGMGVNVQLTKDFIDSNFDMSLIKDQTVPVWYKGADEDFEHLLWGM